MRVHGSAMVVAIPRSIHKSYYLSITVDTAFVVCVHLEIVSGNDEPRGLVLIMMTRYKVRKAFEKARI